MMPDRLNSVKLLVVTLLHKAHKKHDLRHGHFIDFFLVVNLELFVYFLKISLKSAKKQVFRNFRGIWSCHSFIDLFFFLLDGSNLGLLSLLQSFFAVLVKLVFNTTLSFEISRFLRDSWTEEALRSREIHLLGILRRTTFLTISTCRTPRLS